MAGGAYASTISACCETVETLSVDGGVGAGSVDASPKDGTGVSLSSNELSSSAGLSFGTGVDSGVGAGVSVSTGVDSGVGVGVSVGTEGGSGVDAGVPGGTGSGSRGGVTGEVLPPRLPPESSESSVGRRKLSERQ